MKKYLTILLEKAVISQTNIGSVSKATTLRTLMKDGVDSILAFSPE